MIKPKLNLEKHQSFSLKTKPWYYRTFGMKDIWTTDEIREGKGSYKLLEKKKTRQKRRWLPHATTFGPAVCQIKSSYWCTHLSNLLSSYYVLSALLGVTYNSTQNEGPWSHGAPGLAGAGIQTIKCYITSKWFQYDRKKLKGWTEWRGLKLLRRGKKDRLRGG